MIVESISLVPYRSEYGKVTVSAPPITGSVCQGKHFRRDLDVSSLATPLSRTCIRIKLTSSLICVHYPPSSHLNLRLPMTVESPNKGHLGDINYKFIGFVLCREVVLFSEVVNILEL